MVHPCESLDSSYSLYKNHNQIYFSVTQGYESYALIKSVQTDASISLLKCISYFSESFKSRVIIYSLSNNGNHLCKAYQYMPDFDNEVTPSLTFSKIFIRKGML